MNTEIATLSWKEECKELLENLNRSKDSIPFRQPVDFEQVPNYLLVVDQPMDLQTVGEQLRDGHYATPTEFSKDVRLIFENSTIYDTDKEWNTMTIRLGFLFEYNFRNILSSYGYRKKAAYRSKSEQVDETSSVF